MSEEGELEGLKYIANSPPHEHGGFHPQTVEIAKAALRHIKTLRARVAELEKRIRHGVELLQVPCGACKDCEKTCTTNILCRVMAGEPATLCPTCDEWWDGPTEYDFESSVNEIKQVECPACREFAAKENV